MFSKANVFRFTNGFAFRISTLNKCSKSEEMSADGKFNAIYFQTLTLP